MRDLISSEIHQISGGEGWSDWQVVATTAASVASATFFIELINKSSYTSILKSVVLCPILPTVLASVALYAATHTLQSSDSVQTPSLQSE